MGVQLSDEGALSTGAVAAAPFLAGATAGLVCDATVFPMDTIRVRQQARYGALSTVAAALALFASVLAASVAQEVVFTSSKIGFLRTPAALVQACDLEMFYVE
ncbi:hypothetical protein FOZ63_006813 [Perkinsus olseni]|uniref:Uncharacterized protein n=1 Tax=Perkinsus olseni TaxID=32597 RepID=A0A7J6RLF0_PEROL|nr:hypothetical protein FOZ63_006813 [Perkinsus olseni]